MNVLDNLQARLRHVKEEINHAQGEIRWSPSEIPDGRLMALDGEKYWLEGMIRRLLIAENRHE